MRGCSKLSILLKFCIGSFFLFCNSVFAEMDRLKPVDLANSEIVIEYLKAVPRERKKMAERAYQYALRGTRRLKIGASWGGVAKSSGESLMSYPTGKAYLLYVESDLRNWSEARKRDSAIEKQRPYLVRQSLEWACGWLNSAIAVESYERSMSDDQRAKLVPYRDCVKRYLDTGNAEPSCVPLQWSGDVPAP